MRLARSASDDPLEWFLYLGVVVVSALGRWFFAWRQARRDGQIHPLRAVLAEDDDSETMRRTPYGGFSSYRQFFGFVGSAAAVALIASLTHGRLQVSLMWTIVPLLTLALAYLDFRLPRKARDRRGERRKAPHQIRISTDHDAGLSPKIVRRRPTLPQGPPCSTIGAERLSFR
ncbi:hypothetical protein, partial [Streptomyces sp. NPDC057910]|uniref:hypothetical protein n=1 Tax=Streptomyces sp. NPDC057910 TaxID=3346278 RepID=UPI0036E08354